MLRAIPSQPRRAFGLVYLNPKHTQASLDELNRCVRDGHPLHRASAARKCAHKGHSTSYLSS